MAHPDKQMTLRAFIVELLFQQQRSGVGLEAIGCMSKWSGQEDLPQVLQFADAHQRKDYPKLLDAIDLDLLDGRGRQNRIQTSKAVQRRAADRMIDKFTVVTSYIESAKSWQGYCGWITTARMQ